MMDILAVIAILPLTGGVGLSFMCGGGGGVATDQHTNVSNSQILGLLCLHKLLFHGFYQMNTMKTLGTDAYPKR